MLITFQAQAGFSYLEAMLRILLCWIIFLFEGARRGEDWCTLELHDGGTPVGDEGARLEKTTQHTPHSQGQGVEKRGEREGLEIFCGVRTEEGECVTEVSPAFPKARFSVGLSELVGPGGGLHGGLFGV